MILRIPQLRPAPTAAPRIRQCKPANAQRVKKKRTRKPRRVAKGEYAPTEISPEAFFEELGKLRREARDEIELLLAFLDRTEPCPDLEPSLGQVAPGMLDECEVDLDLEPALGATEAINNSLSWRGESSEDREVEDEHDEDGGDDEPEETDTDVVDNPHDEDTDAEPALGWPEGYADGSDDMGNDRDLEEGALTVSDTDAVRIRRLSKHDSTIENVTLEYGVVGKPRLRHGKPLKARGQVILL